jgi:hypothetical protein
MTPGGMPTTSFRYRPTSRRWTTKPCRRPTTSPKTPSRGRRRQKFKNTESKLDKSQSQLTKSTPHVVNVASIESKLGKSEIKTLQRMHCSRRRLHTSPWRSPTSGGMPATSGRMRPTPRRWSTNTCRRPVRARSACERVRKEQNQSATACARKDTKEKIL